MHQFKSETMADLYFPRALFRRLIEMVFNVAGFRKKPITRPIQSTLLDNGGVLDEEERVALSVALFRIRDLSGRIPPANMGIRFTTATEGRHLQALAEWLEAAAAPVTVENAVILPETAAPGERIRLAGNGGELEIGADVFLQILHAARQRGGWSHIVTVVPGAGRLAWGGMYYPARGQLMERRDASALAAALERAFPAIFEPGPIRRTLSDQEQLVADLARLAGRSEVWIHPAGDIKSP